MTPRSTPAPGPHAKRTDVDAWLATLARALRHAQSARQAVDNAGGERAIEAHLQRLAHDPQYTAAVTRLIDAATAWTGDLSDFLSDHRAEIEQVPADLRWDLNNAISGRSGQRRLHRWALGLKNSGRDLHRSREAAQTLRTLTGAGENDDVFTLAASSTPLLDWADFEALLAATEPSASGESLTSWHNTPPRDETQHLDWLVGAIESSRTQLGRAAVESTLMDEPRVSLRERLHRLVPFRDGRVFDRNEAEVRAALEALGYPPAGDRIELAGQVRAVLLTRPENLTRYLSRVRRTADDLMAATNTTTLADAVRKANAILKANAPYEEHTRTGVVVYGGGLPGLGKRR